MLAALVDAACSAATANSAGFGWSPGVASVDGLAVAVAGDDDALEQGTSARKPESRCRSRRCIRGTDIAWARRPSSELTGKCQGAPTPKPRSTDRYVVPIIADVSCF